MLNEYPSSLLPDKLKSMLKQQDIKNINELDNNVTKWYFIKWMMMITTCIGLISAMITDSNFILFLSFGILAIYFIAKYREKHSESELQDYLINLQIFIALYEGEDKDVN